jgi:hypothetical protein
MNVYCSLLGNNQRTNEVAGYESRARGIFIRGNKGRLQKSELVLEV